MADYKDIKGFPVQNFSSDQTAIGQIYYNSASNTFKGITAGAGSWASGGSLNVTRKGINGFGTQTAAIGVGGQGGPGNSEQVLCESYNGTSWTEVNNVNNGKVYRGNCGVQTAGLLVGGGPATTDTEEWDGTSWTETANYPVSIIFPQQLGVQTAAFVIGGYEPYPTGVVTTTNTYNGTAFTSSTANNTARNEGAGAGTTTAAIIAAGATPSATANTEVWDGSSWTEVNNLNTGRTLAAGSGTTSTSMLVFSGALNPTPFLAATESWDGTSWTEVADLATARSAIGSSTNGSAALALAFGGAIQPGLAQSITEEWTLSDFEVKTLTTS